MSVPGTRLVHSTSAFGGRFAPIRAAARLLSRWYDRYRQRLELAELDDRLLRDIGKTRAHALEEAAKPFWR